LNGFFVTAEISFVRIRKTRLEELTKEGNEKAQLLLKIISSLDTYLSATQLGVTSCSLALGWLGEPAAAALLTPLLYSLLGALPAWLLKTVSFALSFILIIFLEIVLGELVPRAIALRRVEEIALGVARPIHLFCYLIYPLVQLFNKSALAILRLLPLSPDGKEDTHTPEELKLLVGVSEREGVIDSMESRIINNALDFSDLLAREVMVPRQDTVFLCADVSFEENLAVIRASVHTRYPIYEGDKDHVIGIAHIRGVIDLLFLPPEERDITRIMRESVTIPEGLSISAVFHTLQKKHAQMAVVADEYGGTAGIVTVEDLMEEIVGDIQDEYDQEEEPIVRNADGSLEFGGLVLLDAVEELLDIELSEHAEDTVGGYIFGLLGRRPLPGDSVRRSGYVFTVERVRGFRVERVRARQVAVDDADVE
jgi:CBS domain containing-hemolysin-like protein